jgi:hypothetical protein
MKKLGSVLCVLCFVSQLGFARGRKDSWENLNRLRVGEKTEVVDLESASHRGTFLSFSDDKIVLRVEGAEVPIQRVNVLRVVSRQPRRLRNAAIGAAIGVGAGLGIGIPLWMVESATVFPGILGPLVGGGAGAGIGAVVPLGARTIYRVKKPSSSTP